METASYFAKKHGLEHYHDHPEELNETIIKLLVLQEALQQESRRMATGDTISVSRSAAGRFAIACRGEAAYRYAVETAFRGATALVPLFQQNRFRHLLEKMGVPGERIDEYCATVVISDDTQCIDPE
ncbi:MAG: hypothetical protein M0042_06740 [Nitrospiraceae bacterium]|nr:hypothetical protein [Nitrospiraceae bacterium]